MRKAHDELLADILLALGSRDDCKVWRNFTGTVRAVSQPQRVFEVGLQGSGDILGLKAPAGRMFAIEVKSGKARKRGKQPAFEAMMIAMGGTYILARSVEDAVKGVDAIQAACTDFSTVPLTAS